jgi:hypothetical protein
MGHQNMIGGTRHRVERGRYDTGGGTAAELGSRVERLTTDARGGARARQHAGARLSCVCPLRGFELGVANPGRPANGDIAAAGRA